MPVTLKDLKLQFDDEIKLTSENIYDKLMTYSSLYHKYMEMYTSALKEINKLKIEKDKVYGELYHAYRFQNKLDGYDISKTTEVDIYVKQDEIYYRLLLKINSQEEIVKFLEGCVKIIDKLSYTIRSIIEYQKFKNGMI